MIVILSLSMVALSLQTPPPSVADLRKLYEAGKYGEVAAAVSNAEAQGAVTTRLLYLAAQSAQKATDVDRARQLYSRLAEGNEDDPWRYIGQSAVRLLQPKTEAPEGEKVEGPNPQQALEAAQHAVSLNPDLPEAQYQLGLACSFLDDFPGAAAAFEKAARLDSTFAYAEYYAGLAYYRAKRTDLMAVHFERFLKLAPGAPERPEVESIMRTLRRR